MNRFIIFGCGYHGRAVFRILSTKNCKIVCWIDNDKKKHYKKLFGKKILPVSDLRYFNIPEVIFAGRNIKSQIKQFQDLKIKNKIQIWNSLKIKQPLNLILKREKSAQRILKMIIKKIEKNNIFYWVDNSGLLQIIRDKKISILSDFDISFYFKDHKKILKIFKTNIFYKVIKKKISKNKTKIFITGKNNYKYFEPPIFDFGFKELKKQKFFDSFNNKYHVPIKYLDKFKNYNYKKLNLRIPLNYLNYLGFLYGRRQWKMRAKFFNTPLAKKNRPFLGPLDH